MFKAKNLTKYYNTEKVLNKISFNIEPGHKIALVGYNGTGKSTLIKIMADLEVADIGQIEKYKHITVGFLPQDPNEYNKQKVIKYIENYAAKSFDDQEAFYRKIEIMFAGFALPSEIKEKKIGELSSGQKTKVFLTAILLKKPDLMLLDEPTNNLDLPALIWLEDFLQNTEATFVVVSHDRVFLDKVANKIYEINWQDRTLSVSNGTYTNYLIQKGKEKERQQLQHVMQRENLGRLRNTAEDKVAKAKAGAKYVGTDNDRMLRGYRRDKAGDSYKDAKMLYRRIKRTEIIEKPVSRKDFFIDITAEDSGQSRDISAYNLMCGYDDGFSIGPVNLEMQFGSRACILGLNGQGKSTILKTLTGTIPALSGDLIVGSGVKFGNLMQEHQSLPANETVLGFLEKRLSIESKEIYDLLLHFGFPHTQAKVKIGKLSPGGRARLLLAYFSATNVNVLVLDEPTNHLDIEAEEAIEKTLANFEGTVLAVTHDRAFLKKVPFDSLYVLDSGLLKKITDFDSYVLDMEQKAKKLLRLIK